MASLSTTGFGRERKTCSALRVLRIGHKLRQCFARQRFKFTHRRARSIPITDSFTIDLVAGSIAEDKEKERCGRVAFGRNECGCRCAITSIEQPLGLTKNFLLGTNGALLRWGLPVLAKRKPMAQRYHDTYEYFFKHCLYFDDGSIKGHFKRAVLWPTG